jgi:multiple inositol-polyphosphate phosphatase/2,3-bisphosphoglycerate 3-phosphatase
MRKIIIALLLCYGFTAKAQNCVTDFLGTKTLYIAPAVKYTPAPAGYLPVFINHVGRHGARHLTKEVNTAYAYSLLFKADSAHALTPKGKELLQMVTALDKVEKGNVKSISAEGKDELKGIGERMYARYNNVFKGDIHLNVAFTKEIRTKQSADAFLAGLKKNSKTEPIISEYNDDTDLRFYDASPVYKQFEDDGEWVKYREAIAKAGHLEQVNEKIVQQWFITAFLKTLDSDNKEKLVSDIFGFATIVYSLNEERQQAGLQPADVNFISLFTCDEIKLLAKLDLADDYYKKGPGIDANGIQVRIAAPLLVNFIKTADDFVKKGGVNAQLRFAHAETISPFAALLNISTADKPTKTTNIDAIWQASKVIPLSSNIQWIFYRKGNANKYLVKILLNEKEAHISGMNDHDFPYYKWNDLRQFYLNKLVRLHVGLNGDMAAYLQNVR